VALTTPVNNEKQPKTTKTQEKIIQNHKNICKINKTTKTSEKTKSQKQ
jgi:hypothetical protein